MAGSTVEEDHFPEVVEDGGYLNLAAYIGLTEDELTNSRLRREVLVALKPSDLSYGISLLNASLRQLPFEEAGFSDGRLPLIDTPALADKAPLLRKCVDGLQSILEDSNHSNPRALRLGGLALNGGLLLTHPFEDGNGRTSRLLQYLVEFGTERGQALADKELYSVVGKTAVGSFDYRVAIDATPHPAIRRAIEEYLLAQHADYWQVLDGRQRATFIISTLIRAMTGKIEIITARDECINYLPAGTFATNEATVEMIDGRPYTSQKQALQRVTAPRGTNIVSLFEQQYTARSFAAHVSPEKATEALANDHGTPQLTLW